MFPQISSLPEIYGSYRPPRPVDRCLGERPMRRVQEQMTEEERAVVATEDKELAAHDPPYALRD